MIYLQQKPFNSIHLTNNKYTTAMQKESTCPFGERKGVIGERAVMLKASVYQHFFKGNETECKRAWKSKKKCKYFHLHASFGECINIYSE